MYLLKKIAVVFFLLINHAYSQLSVAPNYIFALHDDIVNDRRYAQCGDTNSSSLPFGLLKEIGSTKYIIAIDSATFFPSTTYLRAYMALDFPNSSDRIAFAAQNIQFNPKGVSAGSNSRLLLVSKHVISLGPKTKMVIEPDGNNFVEWDCNGYKAIKLQGYFEFSNSMFVPDPSAGNDSVVKASFSIYTQDIHNFIAQVSITPFMIKGLNDISFSVLDATVDMSELINASGMVFPSAYPNTSGANINTWTGFYLKQAKVKLPPELSKGEERVEIYADNLLIDDCGISGVFGANNILSVGEGNMSGWGFSVDNISISLLANKFNGASLTGAILLPISKENPLQYSASVMQNPTLNELDYTFTAQPANNISVQAFSSTMDLYNTSRIVVSKNNGRFKPQAILNGKITLDNELAKLKGLSFEQFVLVTEKPYITNGIFALVSSAESDNSNHVSRFPISVNNFVLYINSTSIALGFNVAINFMSKEDRGFAANSLVKVQAKTEILNDKISFKYDGIEIGRVSLDARTNFFQLIGTVSFLKNDPLYGKGFYGSITMQFDKFINSPVSVSACFGNVEDYKYWFVDAAIPIKIPIGSGLSFYRLMGGLRYHMKYANEGGLVSSLYSTTTITTSTSPTPQYIPDKNIGIAFKAGVTVAPTINDKTINGDVVFEIAFNTTGGLNSVRLAGDVFAMVTINDRLNKPASAIPVRANMLMNYDHTNSSFHAMLTTLINMGAVKGAGQCVAHFDPEVKYVCIGKPSSRFTISLANVISAQSYFMAGNSLEPMPPPPPLVASIVGSNGLDRLRNEDKLTNGSGFVFGASINTSAGKEFGLLTYTVYGNFALTIGFDMMLLDYGKAAMCSNLGVKPGIDGWYSSGQVYTAMQGNVGVKGHAFGGDFNIVVLSGSVAALLNAQLPKPYYFEGRVGCSYNILSLIEGNFDFDFSLGNYCSVVN